MQTYPFLPLALTLSLDILLFPWNFHKHISVTQDYTLFYLVCYWNGPKYPPFHPSSSPMAIVRPQSLNPGHVSTASTSYWTSLVSFNFKMVKCVDLCANIDATKCCVTPNLTHCTDWETRTAQNQPDAQQVTWKTADKAPSVTVNKESSPSSFQEAPRWSILSCVTSLLKENMKSCSNKVADDTTWQSGNWGRGFVTARDLAGSHGRGDTRKTHDLPWGQAEFPSSTLRRDRTASWESERLQQLWGSQWFISEAQAQSLQTGRH